MAARGSFQKRKKEAERREKRQLKLDRRQGRQPAGTPAPAGENGESVSPESLEDSELTSPIPPAVTPEQSR